MFEQPLLFIILEYYMLIKDNEMYAASEYPTMMDKVDKLGEKRQNTSTTLSTE